jgi:hypothetical protein
MYIPHLWHANLRAAKDAIDLNGGLFAIDIGVAEIELGAAKYASCSASPERLTFNAPFNPSEDRNGVENVGAIGTDGASFHHDGRFQGAPHENQSNRNDRQRPQINEAEMGNAEIVQLEDRPDDDKNCAPGASGAGKEVSDTEENQDHGPKAEQRAEDNKPHVIEEQRDTSHDDESTPNYAHA